MRRSLINDLPLILFLFIILTLQGCHLFDNDHCYVPDEEYNIARTMFIQQGSLDLVNRKLHDLEWEPCKITETMYRLTKEFEVLPEEAPR